MKDEGGREEFLFIPQPSSFILTKMDTILNPIAVPGWEQLETDHPTRARVLQALTNLELAYYFDHTPPGVPKGQKPSLPTRKTILVEAIRLGADISPTSQQTVQRHLDELAESGHVIKVDKGKSPWRSRYLLLPATKDPTGRIWPGDEVARRGQAKG